jgi:uncharacterized RDD family membrane protein YckC
MDEQPNEPPKKKAPPPLPPPLKPSNLLDSIFQPTGPMPAAGIGIRGLAFLLDFILLYGVAGLLVYKFGWPANHPGAFFEFNEWMQALWTWAENTSAQKGPPPEISAALVTAFGYALNVMFITFWTYFGAAEAFFGGSSLGKRLCCIRTVSIVTLSHPPVFTGIVRGGLKTTVLFIIFPISAPFTLIGLLFNKRRQMLHDLLSRTAVIDERLAHTHDSGAANQ